MRAFIGIALHPVFSKSVEELIIDVLVYDARDFSRTGGARGHISDNAAILGWRTNRRVQAPSKAQAANLRLKGYRPSADIVYCDADIALKLLPNINSIRMSYDLGQECYRRGPLSWGMSCAGKRCREKTFKLLTMSSATANADKSNQMFYHERELLDLAAQRFSSPYSYTLSDTSFNNLSDSIVQNLEGSCHKLTSFELEFSIIVMSPRLPMAILLKNLLSCAKNLEIIRMNFPWYSDTQTCKRGWKKGVWKIFARNHWPRLRVLHLGTLFVKEEPFTEFLVSHKALKELVLWSTEIRGGTWFNVGKELRKNLQLKGVRLIRISEGSERQIAKWAMDSDMIIGLERFILSGRPNSLGALKAWVSTELEKPLGGQ
jgi:hypothetical protein